MEVGGGALGRHNGDLLIPGHGAEAQAIPELSCVWPGFGPWSPFSTSNSAYLQQGSTSSKDPPPTVPTSSKVSQEQSIIIC